MSVDQGTRALAFQVGLSLLVACGGSGSSSESPRAAALVIVSGDAQSGQVGQRLADEIVVRGVDRHGNAVPAVLVTFSPAPGAGSVSPGQARADAAGNASTRWTLGQTIGRQVLYVSTPDLFATVSATAAVSPVQARLKVLSGSNQRATVGTVLPDPILVQLTDLADAPIAGQPVSCSSLHPGPIPPTATTGADGKVAFEWQLGTLATQHVLTIMAQDPVTGQTVRTDAWALALGGPPATVAVFSGDGQSGPRRVSLGQPLSVLVRDVYGNGSQGAPVSFAVASGGGTVSSPESVSDESGWAGGGTWTLGATTGDQTVVASTPGATVATFHATASEGDPFDGIYVVSVADPACCYDRSPWTISSSTILGFTNQGAAARVAADGTATFQYLGRSTESYWTGAFVLEGADRVTGSGTCYTGLGRGPCSAPDGTTTWTAVRQ